jgi:DNA-binding CsgD family transcriptional regulator
MNANVVINRRTKTLIEILERNNFRNEFTLIESYLEELRLKDPCFFLYDLIMDKSRYFCPSITEMLGFDHRKYLNKSFLFFKNIIHPMDFMLFVDELLTLINSSENMKTALHKGNIQGIPVRIKQKNGDWLKSRIYLIFLKETGKRMIKILIGFIEKDCWPVENNHHLPTTVTVREKEVFRYLSTGYSAKMTANKLSISENTVITHRKNLIQKLQVKNSAEMITRGLEMNILNTPPVFT